MKKSVIFNLLIFVLFSVFVVSCKKETGPTGPQGAVGPVLTGTLQGYVQLYDQYGYRVYHPQDSTILQIGSTTVRTDTSGKY